MQKWWEENIFDITSPFEMFLLGLSLIKILFGGPFEIIGFIP